MKLKELRGRTIHHEPILNVNVEKIEAAMEEMRADKRLNIQNKSQRLAFARWIAGIIEEEVADFVRRMVEGDPAVSSSPLPDLTPQQLRRHNTSKVIQVGDAGVMVGDHHGGKESFKLYNNPDRGQG